MGEELFTLSLLGFSLGALKYLRDTLKSVREGDEKSLAALSRMQQRYQKSQIEKETWRRRAYYWRAEARKLKGKDN